MGGVREFLGTASKIMAYSHHRRAGSLPPLLPQAHYSSLSVTRLGCLPKILIHGIVGGVARDTLVGWDVTSLFYHPIYSYGKVFPVGEARLSWH